jgi:hypothetical protein
MQDIFEITNYILTGDMLQEDKSPIKLKDISLKSEMAQTIKSFSQRKKRGLSIGVEGCVEIVFNSKHLIEFSKFETLDIDLFWRDTVLEAIQMFLKNNKGVSYFPESDQ